MERPYRSHLQPACQACRRRKSRCKQDDLSVSCLMCQVHGTTCEFPARNQNRRPGRATRSRAATSQLANAQPARALQRRISRSVQPLEPHTPSSAPIGTAAGGSRTWLKSDPQLHRGADPTTDEHGHQIESPHIIGPMATSDANALQQYLGSHPKFETAPIVRSEARPVLTRSGMHDSVLFRTVSKRPIGVRSPQNPGQSQLHIIEKLIEPHASRLIESYFEHLNPCFPVLDVESFRENCIGGKEKLSPALMACLYANAMILWPHTIGQEEQRCPDVRFIWVQAEDAIRAELLLAPGLSTVIGILLDVGGRPTTSMLGNAISMGAVISLSHALGLNRDPTQWSISDVEKSARIRLWWAVVIHDRWCSLAYGTPPHIHRSQYDVPLPHVLPKTAASDQPAKASYDTFTYLSSLTEILGDCLEYVYRLKPAQSPREAEGDNVERFLQHVEEWEAGLDAGTRAAVVSGCKHDILGAASLRLAYLSLRMHIQRIRLDEQSSSDASDSKHLPKLRKIADEAAEQVVNYVRELDTKHIEGFWHPVSAFSVASACTLLIRCAIESYTNDPVGLSQSRGVKKADGLLTTLKIFRSEYAWDIGDICISQCEKVVQELLDATRASNTSRRDGGANEDFENEFLAVEELFPSVWDLVDLDYGFELPTE